VSAIDANACVDGSTSAVEDTHERASEFLWEREGDRFEVVGAVGRFQEA
jgi:hypothetical protein